jgi:hypothetical protein
MRDFCAYIIRKQKKTKRKKPKKIARATAVYKCTSSGLLPYSVAFDFIKERRGQEPKNSAKVLPLPLLLLRFAM